MDLFGLLFFAVVAAGIVVVYGYNWFLSVFRWREYHDRRAKSTTAVATGLFICALSIALSILFAVTGSGSLARFGIGTLFMGAFLATGVIIVLERREHRRQRKGGSGGTGHVSPPYDAAGNH